MALDFDGSTDDVDITPTTGLVQNVVGATELAWFAWDMPASENDTVIHVSSGDDPTESRFLMRAEGFTPFRLRFDGRALDTDGESIVGAGTLNTQFRHHGDVADYGNATADIYISGVAVGTGLSLTSSTAGATSNTAPLAANIASQNGGGGFAGVIEDVRIYNRQLTADEIATIHACRGIDGIVWGLSARFTLNQFPPGISLTGTEIIPDWSGEQRSGDVDGTPDSVDSQLRYRRKVA